MHTSQWTAACTCWEVGACPFALGPTRCARGVGAHAAEPVTCSVSVKRQPGSIGGDPGVELCWAALTLWQAVSFLWTAQCADATSKHETRDTANYADATSKLEDKRHYSTQGPREITQPSTS